MVFSVIVWATTANLLSSQCRCYYDVDGLFAGFSPNPATGKLYGTAGGLAMGLNGFASTAFCLVAAAMFLAAAMTNRFR